MKIKVISMHMAFVELKRIIAIALVFALIPFLVKGVNAYFVDNAEYTDANGQESVVFVIDAGHGGEDPGAVGVSGVYEKDLNLAISLAIGEELTKRGYTVVYTRTEDKMLYSPEENIKGFRKLSDLKNRCKITAEYENAYLISIHMNSFGQSKYSGAQVYYTKGNDKSMRLAESVQSRIRTDVQNENNRVIKEGKSMYILENCSGVGILIECGFLTNSQECQKLSEKEYQNKLSFSIVCGILDYVEKAEK